MREYQPWDDTWQEEIVYISIPERLDPPIEMASDFTYPIFIAALGKGLQGEEFWKTVAGAMAFTLGHQPDHPQVAAFRQWLNKYNEHLAKELVYDGATQATNEKLETAIWLFQAAVLLNPEATEAHFNLGLAYYQLGIKYSETNRNSEEQQCFTQAQRYLQNTLELDPGFGLAYYNLGFVYRRMGMHDEGQKYLQKGILLSLDKGVGGDMETSRR